MTSSLNGVLTALATPFAANGQIDVALLRRLVDRNIDGGVHGVVACGSTGEFATMTAAERRLVVEQSSTRLPAACRWWRRPAP